MALFESYERRIDKINGVLAQYGISSVEECREICKAKGFDPYEIVKGIQPICFENACWAYTVGAAIALKKNVKTAAEAAEALSTVKKNLRARQVKITLAAVGGLLALICAFFGWRYWMMHSYVDLPAGDIDVEYRYGGSNWISIRHKDTGVYYTSLGFVTKYYEGCLLYTSPSPRDS